MRDIFFHSWIKYLVSFVYGLFIMALYNIFYTKWVLLIGYIDGFFIAGASLICVGGLSLINYLGGFDIFSYMFSKKQTATGKITFYDYSQNRLEKRKKNKYTFVPYFTVGGLYLIVSIIMLAFI